MWQLRAAKAPCSTYLMKLLQRTRPQKAQIPGAEETQEIGLDDRLAAAGVAFFVGAPTALLTWLLALAVETLFHAKMPHHHWFLSIWAVLVLCGFLFPRSMDEIFSVLWERLIQALRFIVFLLIGTS